MSSPYTAALDDLRRWRDHVTFLIASLEKLEGGAPIGPAIVPLPPVVVTLPAPVPKPAKVVTPPKIGPPRTRERSQAPTSGDAQSTAILTALRTKGRPLTVGELATATKLSYYLLNNRLTQLSANRHVVISGETTNKRVALAGTPAKEEP